MDQGEAKRKYQVFVSSTFRDLQDERQAAVEAILKAGHIPAGMELFVAGDATQMDVIRHWIDESDIFMLILGARYGSIENISEKSYTQLEYEYALEREKPFFSLVISDAGVKKINVKGTEKNQNIQKKYDDFRELVTSKICSFFSDTKDIKLGVYESIRQIETNRQLVGWVSGDTQMRLQEEISKNSILEEKMIQIETDRAKEEIQISENKKKSEDLIFGGVTYFDLKEILGNIKIDLGQQFPERNGQSLSLLDLFLWYSNNRGAKFYWYHVEENKESKDRNWYYHSIGKRLLRYGLTNDIGKVGVFNIIETTTLGFRFLVEFELEEAKRKS